MTSLSAGNLSSSFTNLSTSVSGYDSFQQSQLQLDSAPITPGSPVRQVFSASLPTTPSKAYYRTSAYSSLSASTPSISSTSPSLSSSTSSISSASSTPSKSPWKSSPGGTPGRKGADEFELGIKGYIKDNFAKIVKENEAVGQKGLKSEKQSDMIVHACQLYDNTRNSKWPFVILGRHLKEERGLVAKYGYLTGDRASKKVTPSGAVLGVNPWSCLMNDIFIYAAIKTNKAFRLIVKKETLGALGESYHLSRELQMALLNGYAPFHISKNDDDSNSYWLACPEESKMQANRDLTFSSFRQSIQAISKEAILIFGEKLAKQIKIKIGKTSSDLNHSTLPFEVNDSLEEEVQHSKKVFVKRELFSANDNSPVDSNGAAMTGVTFLSPFNLQSANFSDTDDEALPGSTPAAYFVKTSSTPSNRLSFLNSELTSFNISGGEADLSTQPNSTGLNSQMPPLSLENNQ